MEEIKLKGLNETIYVHDNPSGLKTYMWKNEKIKSVFMTLSVKFGSIDTKFKLDNKTYEVPCGTAHFLEHLKFNMSEGVTAHDEFYKLGGDANAFTTFNYTSYLVFSTQNKKENLKLLLDFVYNPYFTTKMVAKEKGIIVEEANMGSDDAYTTSFFHSLQNVFQNLNYRNLITGTPDDINRTTLEDIKLVYDTFYHPKNMFLCITGNFNPYEMAKTIDDALEQKEFGEYIEPTRIMEREPKKVAKEYAKEELNLTYPRLKYQIKILLKSFSQLGKDQLRLKLLTNLLLNINFGATSLFKEELMTKELITNLYYNVDIYGDYLLIAINASTLYDSEVIKQIENKLNNLEVNAIDLKRKKNATIASLILDYEDIENVNMKIQDEILNYNHIITNLKDIIADIKEEDLTDLISHITLDNVSISVFVPKENQAD